MLQPSKDKHIMFKIIPPNHKLFTHFRDILCTRTHFTLTCKKFTILYNSGTQNIYNKKIMFLYYKERRKEYYIKLLLSPNVPHHLNEQKGCISFHP